MLTGDLEIGLGSLIDRARCPIGGDERLLAGVFTLTEVRRILRGLKIGQLLTVSGLERVDLETCAAEACLGLIDGNLVRLRVDAKQGLAPLDMLVVNDGDFDRLTANPGVDRLLCRADEGIIRRDVRLLGQIVRDADGSQYDREDEQQQAKQALPSCLRWHRGTVAGYGTVERWAQPGVALGALPHIAFVDRDAGN